MSGNAPHGRSRFSPYLRASAAWNVAGLLALAARPSTWPFIVGALVANHLSIVAAGLTPRSRLLGPNLVRLAGSEQAQGLVALTFDDGPDPEVTPEVVCEMEKHGARASFFFIGQRASEHPELVREIANRGHRVENHTFTHPNSFFFLGPSRLSAEIDRTQTTLTTLTGRRPVFVRAPAGFRSPLLESVLASRDLRLASWTRRGFDTTSRECGIVLRRLSAGLAAGDILVLHDRRPRRGGRPVVLDVLPRLLDEIRARGLTAAPIPVDAR